MSESDIMNNDVASDEASPWPAEAFDMAEASLNGKVLRPASAGLSKRGRPRLARPKQPVNLRLDAEVLDHFRATGPGWQGRINAVLRNAMTQGADE